MRRDEAVEWLRVHLGGGVKAVLDVKEAAKAAGLGIGVLKLARAILNVECFRLVGYGPFFMCLPGVERPSPSVIEHQGHSGNECLDDEGRASRLMSEWHSVRNGSGGQLPGLFEQVEWAAEHLLLPMSALTVADVPCGSALSLLLWAKSNEADFRSMYDSKRMERVSARAAPPKRRVVRPEGADLAQASIDGFKKAGNGKAADAGS
jgi:hypothetical protein